MYNIYKVNWIEIGLNLGFVFSENLVCKEASFSSYQLFALKKV